MLTAAAAVAFNRKAVWPSDPISRSSMFLRFSLPVSAAFSSNRTLERQSTENHIEALRLPIRL